MGSARQDYDLVVDGQVVGTLAVRARGSRSRVTARFDTRPGRGALLSFNALCRPLAVTYKSKTYLRLDSLGAGTAACPC